MRTSFGIFVAGLTLGAVAATWLHQHPESIEELRSKAKKKLDKFQAETTAQAEALAEQQHQWEQHIAELLSRFQQKLDHVMDTSKTPK